LIKGANPIRPKLATKGLVVVAAVGSQRPQPTGVEGAIWGLIRKSEGVLAAEWTSVM
jgi:hypothetical protein